MNELDLSRLKLDYFPQFILGLKDIQILDLSFNRIRTIPNEIQDLKNLKSLNLSFNDLEEIPESILGMDKLETLYLNSNRISIIPPNISSMKELKTLILSNNLINKIPLNIDSLQSLETLDLNTNLIMKLPHSFYGLRNLVNLDISSNLITEIIADISQFENIKYLDISSNLLVELPQTIKNLKRLRHLFLSNNYLQTPPLEIIKMDDLGKVKLNSLRNYFIDLEKSDGAVISEAKLIFVGNGRVGKTSTIKQLKYNYFDEHEKSTHGINLEELTIKINEDIVIKCNVWDFGGQEIYHATHRFFLTSRALYVIIWTQEETPDENSQEENFPMDYWLDTVKNLSKSSPVILAQNKIDKFFLEIENRVTLRNQYNVFDFINISAATGENFNLLKKSIQKQFETNEKLNAVYGFLLPKSWIKIKSILIELSNSKKYISYQDYLKICMNEEINETSAQTLSYWLHEAGRILHFVDSEHLWEILILQPKWATEIIYKFINEKIILQNGFFTLEDLMSVWEGSIDFYTKKKELNMILELMKRFEICFKLDTSDTFVIPQLLTKCDLNLNQFIINTPLHISRRYDFFHKGVFFRLLVRLSRYLKGSNYWQNAFVLELDETIAVLEEASFSKGITIIISGKNKSQIHNIINVELNKLQKDVGFSDRIRTYCKECRNSTSICLNDLNYVKVAFDKHINLITCPFSHEFINVNEIFSTKTEAPNFVLDIRMKISNGKTFEAIEALLKYSEYQNRKLYNDILVIKSNFVHGNKMFQLGSITMEEQSAIISKINSGILALIEEF